MTINWQDSFDPKADGLYLVSTNHRQNPSPYHRNEVDATNHGRFTVRVRGKQIGVWTNKAATFDAWDSFNAFLAARYPGDKVTLWHGPEKYHRPCFKCAKPIFPVDWRRGGNENEPEDDNLKHVLQSDDAADLRTQGHYGCTFIDSMGSEEISILICDYCLVTHGDRVLWFDIGTENNRYNFRTEAERRERSNRFVAEEIRLMEAAGFEWRNYTDEFEIATDINKADWNNCGWYAKDWQPSHEITVYDDGSRAHTKDWEGRFKWHTTHPDLFAEIERLRDQIFHPNDTPEFLAAEALKDEMRRMRCSTPEELRTVLARLSDNLKIDDHVDHEATRLANAKETPDAPAAGN